MDEKNNIEQGGEMPHSELPETEKAAATENVVNTENTPNTEVLTDSDGTVFKDDALPSTDDASFLEEAVLHTEEACCDGVFFEEGEENHAPLNPIIETSEIFAPDPKNTKGVRFFALVLAFVLVLCCGITAGYFFGNGSSGSGTVLTADLEAKPKNGDMQTAAQVYETVNPSVVGIIIYNSSKATSASGVVYTEDGYIITNDHIYDGIGAAKFKVFTSDGKEYSAEYVAGDSRSDIAVIRVTDNVKLTPAVFGNPDELYIGEPVVAVGRPTGAETANNLTGGYISFMGRHANVSSSYSMKYIQTDTAINPGSSGGALLNMYSQVVGITSSKIAGDEYEGMSFAIPMTIAKRAADSLIANGYVEGRAKLGISYREIDSVTADIYDMTRGLNIASIDESSDLFGKVAEGDTIVAVNGNDITSADVMLDVIEQSAPEDQITLSIVTEGGKTKTVTAKLLPDKGTSSYVATEESASSESSSSASNSSEFNFPFGE